MSYEVKGKVIAEPQKAAGIGQNGPWARATVVIEVPEGQYPYKMALENKNKAEDFARLKVGDEITAKFNVTSREYNGKWYTSASCFDWSTSAPAATAPVAEAPARAGDVAPTKSDDLPF